MNVICRWIWDWSWLIRLTVVANIALLCACGNVMCGNDPTSVEGMALVIAISLLAAGGFIINDIIDEAKDRINHPNRPIPSGRIIPLTAQRIAIGMISASIAIPIFLENLVVSVEMLLGLFLIVGYSWICLKSGWLGNVATASLSLLPWTLPAGLTGQWGVIVVPAGATFLLVLSREILLDIQDIEGDRQSGIETLPIAIGERIAAWISAFLLGLVCVGVVSIGIWRGYTSEFFIIISLGICLPGVTIIYILLKARKRPWIRIAGHLGKIQFICGICAWWLVGLS